MQNNNKITYVIIIILLVIFTLLTLYGTYLKIFNIDINLNKDMNHYYDGSLYFYEEDSLVGTYKCKTTDNCVAQMNENNKPLITNNFTFIYDNNEVIVYNLISNTDVIKLSEIKYNNSDYMLAKTTKWGIFDLNKMQVIIPFEYDSIEINNNNFLVNKDNKEYMINNSNEVISEEYDDIISVTNDYIFIQDRDYIKIYDYNGLEYLYLYDFINYYMVENNYILTTDEKLYIYENLEDSYIYSENIENKEIEYKDNKIYIDNNLLQIN